MTHTFLEPERAATYCGVPHVYLMRQLRQGVGPAYIMPSPKKILFRQEDLDAWIDTWERRQPGARLE